MSEPTILPDNIFNLQKTDYQKPEIILGQKTGIFDTVNNPYPELWKIYLSLRSQDWSFDEFDYSICNIQFKTCEPHIYDMMVKNLAWQWEADSIFGTKLIQILSNVCTSDQAWAGWSRISENEVLHSSSYSEIVRNSFDDPKVVLDEILNVKEAHSRLSVVSEVFDVALTASHEYSLGFIPNDQDLYNKIYLFLISLLCGERIQFMASFAVTFGLCESTGLFMPAGKCIQKIAQDEFEIHVQFGKEVLKELNKTERGKLAYEQCMDEIIALVNEVNASEEEWVDYAFSEGRELTGITREMMIDWVHFSSSDVAVFLGIQDSVNFPIVRENPLVYLENWINISNTQSSAQEENIAAYKVNLLVRNDENINFDISL